MKTNLLAVLALCSIPVSVFADVTVVRSLKLVPHTAEGSIQARNTLQIHGSKSRRQTEIFAEGSLARDFAWPLKTVTLISLDKGLVYRMDSPRQGYKKMSLSRWRRYEEQGSASNPVYEISQSWSRALNETGTKILQGVECSKFAYEWRFELYNPEAYSKKQYVVRTTLWLTEITPALRRVLAEQAAFQQPYHKKMGGTPLEDLNGLTLHYGGQMTGIDKRTLFAALQQGTARLKKIQGYPIASQTEWFLVGSKSNKPLFTIHSQLETISLQTLKDSEFIPPANVPYDNDPYDIDATLLSQAK